MALAVLSSYSGVADSPLVSPLPPRTSGLIATALQAQQGPAGWGGLVAVLLAPELAPERAQGGDSSCSNPLALPLPSPMPFFIVESYPVIKVQQKAHLTTQPELTPVL